MRSAQATERFVLVAYVNASFPDRAMMASQPKRVIMAQKGAGGNAGAITSKGGDGASGSTGTGRGGGNDARGKSSAGQTKGNDKRSEKGPGKGKSET